MEFDIHIEGVRLTVLASDDITTNDRPPIIFLHDSLGCIRLWRDFPEKVSLSTGLPFIIYDREGYGSSQGFRSLGRDTEYLEKEADVLNSILTDQRIEKAILFGHSDGGTIALIAASKYPDKIIGVITEGAHVFAEPETLKGIREAVTSYKTTDLKEKLQKYHGQKTDNVFAAWTDTWLHPSFREWNVEHFLSNIKCPVLIIQGTKDEYGTEKQVDAIVSQVSGKAEKMMIRNAAHSPHKEAMEITLNASTRFIEELL